MSRFGKWDGVPGDPLGPGLLTPCVRGYLHHAHDACAFWTTSLGNMPLCPTHRASGEGRTDTAG